MRNIIEETVSWISKIIMIVTIPRLSFIDFSPSYLLVLEGSPCWLPSPWLALPHSNHCNRTDWLVEAGKVLWTLFMYFHTFHSLLYLVKLGHPLMSIVGLQQLHWSVYDSQLYWNWGWKQGFETMSGLDITTSGRWVFFVWLIESEAMREGYLTISN
jgi:hypothetical protein